MGEMRGREMSAKKAGKSGWMHISEAARRKIAGPEGWEICFAECIGGGRDFLVAGGVARLLKRGPHKGKKTWDGPRQRVVVTGNEIDAEYERYEAESGKCGDCMGRGAVVVGWSVTAGAKTQTCSRCGGSGEVRMPKASAQAVLVGKRKE
jgi:hypothetical protein